MVAIGLSWAESTLEFENRTMTDGCDGATRRQRSEERVQVVQRVPLNLPFRYCVAIDPVPNSGEADHSDNNAREFRSFENFQIEKCENNDTI